MIGACEHLFYQLLALRRKNYAILAKSWRYGSGYVNNQFFGGFYLAGFHSFRDTQLFSRSYWRFDRHTTLGITQKMADEKIALGAYSASYDVCSAYT